nr:hypothetical protein [Tanacetum cinerariifolium]
MNKLMEDMLLLEKTPKEEKSQEKTVDPPFSQDPKSSHDDGFKPLSDDGKKVNEVPSKGNECNDQEKEYNVNSTNNVNTVSSTVNAVGTNKDHELSFDLNMSALEDVSIFNFK